MTADPLFALSLAVIVAALYLVVLRAIDINEREPLWALALVLLLGAFAGAVAAAVVDPGFRVLSTFGTAITAAVATFIALALGAALLEGVASLRGWSEFNGLVDGIVYGAAAGLGVATGEAFVRELSIGGVGASVSSLAGETSAFGLLWTTLLTGLSQGMFGALIGAGFGAALTARSALRGAGLPVLALAAAILLQAGYVAFAEGNSLAGGAQATIRHWVALLLPLALIAVLFLWALRQEANSIAEELADEGERGVVSGQELQALRSARARRAQYLRTLAHGDIQGWLTLRALHNRQVQLALTERRARGERDPSRRRDIDAEAERLRSSILSLKPRGAGEGGGAEATRETSP